MERKLASRYEDVSTVELYAVVSSNGRIRYISSNSTELIGYSPTEITGKYMKDYIHTEDLFLIESYFFNKHHQFPCSFRFLTKAGGYIWFEAEVDFIQSKGNHEEHEIILKMRGLIPNSNATIEAAECKEPVLVMEEHEEWSVLENLPMPVFIALKGELCFINKAFQELIGARTKDQLLGKHTNNFIKKDFHSVSENRQYRLHKGEKVGIIEETWKTVDGRDINVEIIASLTRVRGEDAELVVLNDISSRRNYQKILQKSRERYQRLVDNSIDTIAVIHNDQFVFINESGIKLFGAIDYSEMLGKNIYEYLHHRDHQSMGNSLKSVLDGTSEVQVTKQSWIISEEKKIYTEMVSIPTTYFGEQAVQIILRDISYRKKTEEVMLRSEKLSIAGQLAAGIAHEIRNPLTAIKGFLQIMHPELTNHRQYLHIIFSELNRIEMILSELLMLAKPQETKFNKANLISLLNDVAMLLETQGNMKNVLIVQSHERDTLIINCDENQLKQVFINLFKNAIDAMPKGGKIKVSTEKVNQSVRINVRDEGVGISPDLLKRIGEPFLTTKEKGNGLGLMISYKIIESHRGSFTVESELGKGSTFKITLPCEQV